MKSYKILNIIFLAAIFLNINFAVAQQQKVLSEKNKIVLFLNSPLPDSVKWEETFPFVEITNNESAADVSLENKTSVSDNDQILNTLIFIGKNLFLNKNNEVSFLVSKTDKNSASAKVKLVNAINNGLVFYTSRTAIRDNMKIQFKFKESSENKVVEDKWHSWVFNLGMNGYSNLEKSSQNYSFSQSIRISKVTADWKIENNARSNLNYQRYSYDDYTYEDKKWSYYFDNLTVKSISKHWSIGGSFNFTRSIYSNAKFHYGIAPAIEYNVFPYSEATVHRLTFLYKIGAIYNDYFDTTMYFKAKEYLAYHNLGIGYALNKKWGDLSISISGSNYLHDYNFHNLSLFAVTNIRITQKLTFNILGNYSIIKDQLTIAKGNLTKEEVLMNRKQLQTNFSYFVSFGVTFSFGSLQNHVVNPRFTM